MTQPRIHSAVEALANVMLGILISYVVLLTLRESAVSNAAIVAIMTVASLARQYALRRVFDDT